MQRQFTLLNRVPFGKFNGVNALIQGDLSAMRDVAFLVRLPEGATGIPKVPAFFGRAFAGRMRHEAKKSRQGNRYPASCKATCVVSRQAPAEAIIAYGLG